MTVPTAPASRMGPKNSTAKTMTPGACSNNGLPDSAAVGVSATRLEAAGCRLPVSPEVGAATVEA